MKKMFTNNIYAQGRVDRLNIFLVKLSANFKTVVLRKTRLKFSGKSAAPANLLLRSKTGYSHFHFSNSVLQLWKYIFVMFNYWVLQKKCFSLLPTPPPLKAWTQGVEWNC